MKWPDPSYPLEQTGRFIKNTEIVHRLPNSKDIKTNTDLVIPMATSCYIKNQAHSNRAKFPISGNLRKSVAELDFYLRSCSLPILRVKKGRYYYMLRVKKGRYYYMLRVKKGRYYYILRVKKGRYYYMCTRNNNFTNRSQKGRLVVR